MTRIYIIMMELYLQMELHFIKKHKFKFSYLEYDWKYPHTCRCVSFKILVH